MSIDRRSFIRSLSGQAVRSVGAALAITGQVRQEIEGQLRDEAPTAEAAVEARSAGRSDLPAALGSAEIVPWAGEAVELGAWADEPAIPSILTEAGVIAAVDQRQLPADVVRVTLGSAGEVVQAIRDGVIDGGLAIVGAAVQTLAMVADRASSAPPTSRAAIVSGAARAWVGARPDVPLLRAALGAFVPDLDRIEIPSLGELRAAAESRAETVRAEHRALASIGAGWLRERFGPATDILLVGEFGPTSSASIGTTSSVLRAAAEAGMHLRVWVADGEPLARGAALLRASIGAAAIDVQSIPDAHLHRLLIEHDVKVVLLGASWVGGDGSFGGQLGSTSAALLARRREIQVVGVASRSMVVRESPGHRVAATHQTHRGVPLELVDGQLLDLTLTEVGVVGPGSIGRLA